MTYERLIVFCDYGLDDAIATLHILDNAELFGAIDVVPIGGNVPVAVAFRNAQTLLAAAHPDKSKVRIVDTRGISQPAENIPDVHGGDGMGDVLTPANSELDVVGWDAFVAEIAANKAPARDCVLSLGPCTLPAKLGYIPFCTVLMGGTTNEPPNYGGYEFNEGMDVAAFADFAAAATAVATLDSCHGSGIDFEHADLGGELAARFAARYIEMCKARHAPLAVYDYVAALAVTHPQLFDAVRVRREDGVEYNELRKADA